MDIIFKVNNLLLVLCIICIYGYCWCGGSIVLWLWMIVQQSFLEFCVSYCIFITTKSLIASISLWYWVYRINYYFLNIRVRVKLILYQAGVFIRITRTSKL